MVTVREMRERWERLNIIDEAAQVMGETSDVLTGLNQTQLHEGEMPDGSPIEPDYKPLTKFLKQQKGQPWDRVTLYDTGSFYNAMTLRLTGQDYEIDSLDPKTAELTRKYGEVFGLQPDNQRDYRETVLYPGMAENIKEKTGCQ